jgi:hypothetical protein
MDGQEKDRTGWHREAVSKNPNVGHDSTPAMRHKWQRIAASFLTGRSWHAIEAVRELGTTCLHSDVSDLEVRGLRFHRERVSVPGFGGAPASVVRYRLRPESFAHARELLGMAPPQNAPQGDDAGEYRRASGG